MAKITVNQWKIATQFCTRTNTTFQFSIFEFATTVISVEDKRMVGQSDVMLAFRLARIYFGGTREVNRLQKRIVKSTV